MSLNRKTEYHASRAKNLIRGALSILRAASTPVARRDPWKQEQLAQQQINKALAIAKKEFDQRRLSDFERWVSISIREQNRSTRRVGTHLTSLSLFPSEIQPRSLKNEISLAVDRIQKQYTELLILAKDVTTLADAVAHKDWPRASSILKTTSNRDGYSYWAIETEVALKQATEGVEKAKTHIASMSIGSTALNKFFLHNFGVRNEPAQTSFRFRANLRKRIDEIDISVVLRSYIKYRLYGSLEADHSNLANILAYEQLTTTADLLFTLIKVTRIILGNQFAFSNDTISEADSASESLSTIMSTLGISTVRQHGTLSIEPSNSLLEKLANNSIQTALNPPGEWSANDCDSQSFIVRGLASQLSTRSDGILAEEMSKTLLNFSWLPLAIEVGDIATVPNLPTLLIKASQDESISSSAIYSINDALKSVGNSLVVSQDISLSVELKHLISGVRALRMGSVEEALSQLKKINSLPHGQVGADTLKVALAHHFRENGDMMKCLEICAQVGMENDRIIPMLPLMDIFQGIKWPSLRPWASSVDLAITLDHFLRGVDDRKSKTHKRYAIEELLKRHQCTRLVDLPSALAKAGVEIRKIEFLCYYVCDIVTFELLPGIDGSRNVLLARKELLCALAALHTEKELSYLLEAEEIDDELQVDDGLFVLGDSKVYVDEQAVLNFVNKEMAADFQRYLMLVDSGLGASESITELIKSFRNPSARTFQIPKNDADDLLAEILDGILNRFLFDPASGLDIIIGRRIRHGTIASEIRGVLEAAELIGHKPRPGANYEAPTLVNRLPWKLDPKQRRIINAAFGRFSESIDQLIALLRDEYFYVRSKDKTRGIFDLHLTPILFALARTTAQKCSSIDQFSKECVSFFWYPLSMRLEALRPSVESETKKTLHAIFSKLTSELKALNLDDTVFLAQLQQVSDELQRRASTIASWIRVPNTSVESRTYSMQQVVDVAVAVITGQRPGFTPVMTSSVPEDIELDTHGFSIVSDALYIALDNICQHSGKKIDNNISVDVVFNPQKSILSFSITSDVAPGSRTTEKESRLNSILSDIQRRAYGERARLNRGSGLFKLAAIVMQSEETGIHFGYTTPNRFQLKFDLVYLTLAKTNTPPSPLDGSLSPNIGLELLD